MSATYTQFPHTNFPDAVDDDKKYGYLQDVPYSMKDKVLAYQKAFSEGDTVECERLLSENPTLAKCMWKAIDYNWMRDAVLAMENYYISDVTAAIDEARGHAVGLNDNIKPGQAGAASSGWSINKLGNTFVGGTNAIAIDGNTLTYKSYTGSDLGSVTIPNNNKSHAGFVPVPSGETDDDKKYRFWSTNASGVPGWYKYDKLHDLVTKDTEKPLQFWTTGSDGNPLWRPMSSFNASASRSGFMSSGTYQSLFNKKADGTAKYTGARYWGTTDDNSEPNWHLFTATESDTLVPFSGTYSSVNGNDQVYSLYKDVVKGCSYFAILSVSYPADTSTSTTVHRAQIAVHTSNTWTGINTPSEANLIHDGRITLTHFYAYPNITTNKIYGLYRHNSNVTLDNVNVTFCVLKLK